MVKDSVKLNTGAEIPTVGLGTWRSQPGEVEQAVAHALTHGYKHIDTASNYGNETEVGKGIKESKVPRENIFLTSKLNNCDHKRLAEALQESLQRLDTPYLDLWLMHWPAPMTPDMKEPDKTHDWLITWKNMEMIYKMNRDKVRAIGVSNFSIKFLQRLLDNCEIVPAVNQIEMHPSCPQQDVVDFCNEQGIVVTAFSPLGSEDVPLLQNQTVKEVARAHGVNEGTVLVSLQANRPNTTVLTKSVKKERVEENAKLIDLDESEVKRLLDIDKAHHHRELHPSWTGWGDLGFPDCIQASA